MKRTLLLTLVVAALGLVLSGLHAGGAAARTQGGSCSNYSTIVLGRTRVLSRLRASGTTCKQASKISRQWLDGLYGGTGQYALCAPPLGSRPETCSVGGYRCVATGAQGAVADTVTCRLGRRSISWLANLADAPPDGGR